MGFHLGQHRIGRPVEQLNRRDVRLKVTMRDELLKRLLVSHQSLRCPLIEVSEQMPYAVTAIQGAADDVVEAQTAFAVLHGIPEARVDV
ncbi:hypothetical protein D9M68_896100 [compost metagenome]